MRGFDYRSDTGIALLLCKQLDSKRAFLQAMGRVGRMGDTAQWFKLQQVGNGYTKGSVETIGAMRYYCTRN